MDLFLNQWTVKGYLGHRQTVYKYSQMMCLSWSLWYWPICCLSETIGSHFVDSKQTNFPECIVGQLMSIANGIKSIHLVGSIDPDSNKFRKHHFSGLDQVIHLVVLADFETDPLKKKLKTESLVLSVTSWRCCLTTFLFSEHRYGHTRCCVLYRMFIIMKRMYM